MEQILKITEFILKSFLHIWPYLLVTIPLAVIVNLSGAAKYINKAFGKNPFLAVLLATIVGAFSPFCSCGVIPVISSLLIGGVPLAPVMSFWIASPSMDPEIFFLSSSMIGWKLAVWRLASTFIISLLSGYVTHFITVKGLPGNNYIKLAKPKSEQPSIVSIISKLKSLSPWKRIAVGVVSNGNSIYCVETDTELRSETRVQASEKCSCNGSRKDSPKWVTVSREILKSTAMVTKFMGLAFLITALITFYLPGNIIEGIISGSPAVQVVEATLIGIPMYTSNLTALPIASGLIDLGLNKGAVLSFLISGATTTLPAMIAVWGITTKRVFLLYLAFSLIGSLAAGLCFNLFN